MPRLLFHHSSSKLCGQDSDTAPAPPAHSPCLLPNKQNPSPDLCVAVWREPGVLGCVVPPVVVLGAVDGEQPGVILAELAQVRAVSELQDFPF